MGSETWEFVFSVLPLGQTPAGSKGKCSSSQSLAMQIVLGVI